MSTAQFQMDPTLPSRDSWPDINAHCAIYGALQVLSTRSAFLVLREALYGATRFDQFVERTGVSEPVAAARLKELAGAGLLEKVPYREPGQRTRSEYRLTEKGSDLAPAMIALYRWGSRWELTEKTSRIDVVHAGCGGQVSAVLACEHGHRVESGELQVTRRARS